MNDPTITTSDGESFGNYRGYNYAIDKKTGTLVMTIGDEFHSFKDIDELHAYVDSTIGSYISLDGIDQGCTYSIVNNYVKNDEFQSKVLDYLMMQPWYLEMIYTRKASWVANSRGGEPNCRREEQVYDMKKDTPDVTLT